MQTLQQNLEVISSQNIKMEQQFEDDINKKNTQSKELGMIIKAINNIYSTCMRNKNAGKGKEVHIDDIMEESPDLV